MNDIPTEHPKNKLKKVLGTGFGIAVLIGSTIGVGILRTPGSIAGLLENYWLVLLCWIFGGVYVLMGAGSFAEMAILIPKAGGPYNYVKRGFGEYAGFLSGWFDFIINAIAPAYFSIVISEYVILLFPVFGGYEKLIAIGFLLAFTLFHLGGIKNGSVAQQVTSLIKVMFFLALIVSCFVVKVDHSAVFKAVPFVQGGVIIALLKSMQLVIGAYDGWWSVCFFAEEDENPAKNIPKSLFTGAFTLMGIYVALNMAIFYVLPVSSVANAPLAASDAANIVFGPSGATLVMVIAIASTISILNAYMMIPARILFGLSRDGFFIRQGTAVNTGGTPVVALALSSLLALILIGTGASFEQLFSLGAFMSLLVLGLTFASLIKLRISEPDLPRPYRAWGYPWTSIVVILTTVGLFIGFAVSDHYNLVLILVITAISYPAFILLTRRKRMH